MQYYLCAVLSVCSVNRNRSRTFTKKSYNGHVEKTVENDDCDLWSDLNHDDLQDEAGSHNRICRYSAGRVPNMPYCMKTDTVSNGASIRKDSPIRKYTQAGF